MLRQRLRKDVDAYVEKYHENVTSDYQWNLKGFEIAKMYMNVGALEAAKDYVGRYLSVRDSSAVAHKFLGQVHESLGDKEKALSSLKRAYELDPSSSDVLMTIARLQSVLVPFDLEEGRIWLAKAQRVSPNAAAVSKLSDTVLYHENQVNGGGSHEEDSLGEDRSVVIPSYFFSTPKTGSQTRRFPPRPSHEKLNAQLKNLENRDESNLAHLDERLDKLEDKNEGIMKFLADVLSEVRMGNTITQNVATEMTMLKKDLQDRDELRMKDITSAVAATTAAVTSLHQQQQLLTQKEPEEDVSLLKQRLKEAEKQAALQQAAFLQFASAGYALGAVRPQGPAPPLPGMLRPDMFPQPVAPNTAAPAQMKPPASWLPITPDPSMAPPGGNSPFGASPMPPTSMRQIHNAPPTNIVISSSDKIPVVGKDPVPTFSGSVTIPPEHRLGVRPLSSPAVPLGGPSHSFQINLPPSLSNTQEQLASPLKKNEDPPPAPISTTSILSKIPDPIYSAVDSGDHGGSNRQRQVSVNSNYTDEEEHDPCPDFKPIIPLPEEVDVVTGEEDEIVLFEDRSKLYRFVDKEWKERGLGQLKILKHKVSGKVRVIMRREQTHKVCANHHILPDIKIEKMKNQDKAVTWSANDFSDEEVRLENFSARFKTPEQADKFLEAFTKAQNELVSTSPCKKKDPVESKTSSEPFGSAFKPKPGSWECTQCYTRNESDNSKCAACLAAQPGTEVKKSPETKASPAAFTPAMTFGSNGGFSFKPTPTSNNGPTTNAGLISTPTSSSKVPSTSEAKSSPFSNFCFGVTSTTSSSGFNFNTPKSETGKLSFEGSGSKVEPFSFGKLGETVNNFMTPPKAESSNTPNKTLSDSKNETYVEDEEHDPCPDFKPIIPLPKEVEVVTGEEDEEILFEKRTKLFRFVEKEWKERGVGQLKILKHKTTKKVRLLMRRDQTLKVCANHFLVPEIIVERMVKKDNAVIWAANDFSDEEVKLEKFCALFKTEEFASEFIKIFDANKSAIDGPTPVSKSESKPSPPVESLGSLDKFKPKPGSWECPGCMCRNEADVIKCPACESIQPGKEAPKKEEPKAPVLFGSVGKSGFTFGGGINSSSTPSSGFIFGNNNKTTTSPTNYEPLPDVADEVELSFKDQSLKLDSAKDAKEVAMKISACKTMHILTLSGNTIGIEAAQALGKSLESHPEFRRAHWKDMFTGRMKTEIPPALKHLSDGIMIANAQLVELDLSDNAFGPIGMEGIKDLLVSRACYSLKELRLNNTGCGVTGGERLSELLMSCLDSSTEAGYPLALKVFVLGRSRQENKGAIALAKVFKRMKSLEEVSIPQNGIYHEGIAALMDAFVANPNLRILNMNDNTFTAKGAESLALALPKLPNLEVLNIGDCLLKTEGANKIASALRNGHSQLKELHMDSNEILEEGGLNIVDSIANKPKLEALFIDGNQFGAEGCDNILRKLKEVGKGHLISEFEDDQEPDEDEENEDKDQEDENEESVSNEKEETTPVKKEPEQSSALTSEVFGGKSNIFSGVNGLGSPNLFGASKSSDSPSGNIFGSKVFGSVFSSDKKSDATLSLGSVDPKASTQPVFSFGAKAAEKNGLFTASNLPSFASISDKNSSIFSFGNKEEGFTFEGTGKAVFGNSASKGAHDSSKTEDNDDNEHDPYFEPIIPLPELVEVNTGEEEEKVLFSHRSKVYRYDSTTKEWKERGIGNIKILHHETKNTFRVLLRRDQIHKIACNHLITEDMCLKPLAASSTALCWFAMDFSEGESRLEQLAVKFKEASTTDKFKSVFEKCQEKLKLNSSMNKDTKVEKEQQESTGDHEEDSEGGDNNEDSCVFSAQCTLFEEIEGKPDVSWGSVTLRTVIDDELYRICAAQNDSEDLICNHFILDDIKILVKDKTCSWSADDFASYDDEVNHRSFRATFENSSTANAFEDIFFEGRDRAYQLADEEE